MSILTAVGPGLHSEEGLEADQHPLHTRIVQKGWALVTDHAPLEHRLSNSQFHKFKS
jgi:hypothetical protein